MAAPETLPDSFTSRTGWRFVVGAVSAALLLLGLAEIFLQFFPPSDLHPYLGDRSPARGILVPDENFGARYRFWDAFHNDNRKRLDAYLPFRQSGSGLPSGRCSATPSSTPPACSRTQRA
jgi:hypothetical protein